MFMSLTTKPKKMQKHMAKQNYLVLIILSLAIVIANGRDVKELAHPLNKWFKNQNFAKEKVTELHFYVEDTITGSNPTNIPVAMANSTATSPTFFGLVSVLDDPLRTEPNINSEIVGRAQGLIVFSSLEQFSIHMTFDLVFTSGAYNGSVLNVVGHNPYRTLNRELAIVGGSGVFRLARGVILATTASDTAAGDAFLDYKAIVLHYA